MADSTAHRPRKRFAQNFLHDKAIVNRIIEAFDPDPGLAVVEIGPGKGALTVPLLRQAGKLNAIEIDTDLAHMLQGKCRAVGDLHLHIGDALKFDIAKLAPRPVQIIGNLPYNISTPLLFHLLGQLTEIKKMLLMLQQEVVDRICAHHNEHSYGRLSVMVQSKCQVEKLFTVPSTAFSPPPKVSSAVIKLIPDPGRLQSLRNPLLFEKIVRQAFNQRRKTLHNALKGSVDDAGLRTLGISPTARAENLSVKNYIDITNNLVRQKPGIII